MIGLDVTFVFIDGLKTRQIGVGPA